MNKRSRVLKEKQNMPVGIFIGVCIALALTFLFSALLALLIVHEHVNINKTGLFTFTITVISSLVSAVIAGKSTQAKPALSCGLSAIIYGLIILGIGILFFDGRLQGIWTSLVAIIIGYLGACTICISKKKGSHIRKLHSR